MTSKKTLTVHLDPRNWDSQVARLFTSRGCRVSGLPELCDLFVFTGGPDICPFLYGEGAHKDTVFDYARDKREVKFFRSLAMNKPKVGICRGGQLLNVMSGGSLWQNVNNHRSNHLMECFDRQDNNSVLEVTSTHHQMMIPATNAWVIAGAREATEKEKEAVKLTDINTKDDEAWDDEVLYYPSTNSLCFQPHPEHDVESPLADYFFECVEQYCFGGHKG